MKRIIVSLIILLALLTTISLAETEIEMITDKDYIKKDEEINVEVNITNTNVAAKNNMIEKLLVHLKKDSTHHSSQFSVHYVEDF